MMASSGWAGFGHSRAAAPRVMAPLRPRGLRLGDGGRWASSVDGRPACEARPKLDRLALRPALCADVHASRRGIVAEGKVDDPQRVPRAAVRAVTLAVPPPDRGSALSHHVPKTYCPRAPCGSNV